MVPELPIGDIHLTIVSGDGQVGAPSVELPAPLVAMVTDDKGKVVKDHLVNFRVVSGGGSVFAGAAMSNDLGQVQDYWTLGSTGSQVVEVRAVDPTTGTKQTFATFTASLPPPVDGDGDGFFAPQDCNDADAAINPGAADLPDPTLTDHNCDGIDGTIASAVFVSVDGIDVAGCGTIAVPCNTIGFGNARAVSLSKTQVYIGVGTYNESVQLRNGVSLYGGFSTNFTSRSAATRARITGSAQYLTTGIMYTVLGENLSLPSSFVALVIEAPDAIGQQVNGSGRHATGILLRNTTANVSIARSDIIAGNGSPGAVGFAGTSSPQGGGSLNGSQGGSADSYAKVCDNTSRGAGGFGGGISPGHGGSGGAGGTMDTDCSHPTTFPFLPPDLTARSGSNGSDGEMSAGMFGQRGLAGPPCFAGSDGGPGLVIDGVNGASGGGLTSSNGLLVVATGGTGGLGEDGGGGGGGGGSGGCDTGVNDSHGAGGGGGGGGGLRAPSGGGGGRPAGASLGIYLSNAIATVQNVDITLGIGGAGGAGGARGLGQPGGLGGPGGLAAGSAKAGGAGGDGGRGGHSGSGGGGSGGPSVGILQIGGSLVESLNTFRGGAGGLGGLRGDGAAASTGTPGQLANVLVIP